MSTLFSIGHGSRSAEAFAALLLQHGIDALIDVRAYPRSRRHPQFQRLALEGLLASHGVRYVWEGESLGGMRRPRRETVHVALTDAAFQGYAEHMASAPFRAGVDRILTLAGRRKVALMCAETLPQHCHRGLVADALVAAGHDVLHIVAADDIRRHVPHPALRSFDGTLIYDGGRQLALEL